MKSITIIYIFFVLAIQIHAQHIPENQRIISEGEIELVGTDARLIFNDLSGNFSPNFYAFHENGNFYITWFNLTTNRNFRMNGANLHLGEGFNGNGTRLSVGNAGDGSIALANSWSLYSDKSLKSNIRTINNGLEKVKYLNPVSYIWKKSKYKDFGFIAQEVEKLLPEIVNTQKETNLKVIDYTRIIPLLTSAIQEQQAIIETKEERITNLEKENQSLNDRLTQLESAVEKLLNAPSGNEQTGIVNPRPFLQQNQSNPFSENTQIQYFVPQHVQQAQLQITTTDGKVLKTFTLQKGNNSINIDARQLAAGSYFYTLIVDGQIAESKQMILTDY